MPEYTTKVISIVNYQIIAAETWEQALNISNVVSPTSIRKWWVKSRENDDIITSFDYNFKSNTPSAYGTNGGQGFAMDGSALSNLWVRARNAATVIEIVFFS